MLLRLAYLGITNAFALLRLLPGNDRDKDAEFIALRHQLAVLQRQLDGQRIRFDPADRAWLAALLHRLPRRRRSLQTRCWPSPTPLAQTTCLLIAGASTATVFVRRRAAAARAARNRWRPGFLKR